MQGCWTGGTIVCIASGPSLTLADTELVRRWRKETRQTEKRFVIVANTTFRIALWADALFAIDREWWQTYGDEVNANFTGRKLSTNSIDLRFNVTKLPKVRSYANSGAGAISAAVHAGAKKVILLGFDCQKTSGKSHWHGDHPKHLGNAGRIEAWHDEFLKLKNDFAHVEIVNATRETALECFDRINLEAALCRI